MSIRLLDELNAFTLLYAINAGELEDYFKYLSNFWDPSTGFVSIETMTTIQDRFESYFDVLYQLGLIEDATDDSLIVTPLGKWVLYELVKRDEDE